MSAIGSGVLDSNVFNEANVMEIRRVGIVGAGTMGNGIAHVFARSGYSVVLCDVEQKFLDRAIGTISKNLEREVGEKQDHGGGQRRSPGTDSVRH